MSYFRCDTCGTEDYEQINDDGYAETVYEDFVRNIPASARTAA